MFAPSGPCRWRVEAVRRILRQQGNGELSLHPRRRLKMPDNALLPLHGSWDPVHDLSE